MYMGGGIFDAALAGCEGATGVTAGADTCAPHFAQNFAGGTMGAPHCPQY